MSGHPTSASDPTTAEGLVDHLDAATTAIRRRSGPRQPRIGLILGSGLGPFANTFEDRLAIDYREIPHFPVSGVEGHAGRLVLGRVGDVECVAMQGRVHYYEGHGLRTVTFPARTLVRLGAEVLIITNAAGGITDTLDVGTLMLIRDHLNLVGDNPLRGFNDERLGPRFPDMTEAYAPALRDLARDAAEGLGLELAEGVYVGLAGPTYETPAEVEMLRRLGGDAVGMSTVPEVIVANHMGARVLGISCITNMAAGAGAELSHNDVTVTAKKVESTFAALLTGILKRLGSELQRDATSQQETK